MQRPYSVTDAVEDVRTLERAGFMHFLSEVVCPKCDGQAEMAFVNTTWLRNNLMAGLTSAVS